MLTYVDMPFIPCTEEEAYASRLVLALQNGSQLADAVPIAHSSEYFVSSHPSDSLHVLTNFEYCWKEIPFEQQLRVKCHAALFC